MADMTYEIKVDSNQALRALGAFAKRIQEISFKTRMDFLGVMFAGQALQNTMMGLLNPALQLTGVFDVLNATLSILFLPAALLLLDVMIYLMDVFTNLPEPLQNFINYLALAGLAIGAVLAFIGQLVVGVTSLANALGIGGLLSGIAEFVGAIIGAIAGVSASVLALAAIIFVPLLVNWESTWKAIVNFVTNMIESIKNIIGGMVQIILGIFTIFFDLVTRKRDKLGDDVKMVFDGFVSLLKGTFGIMYGATVSFFFDLLGAWIGGLGKIFDFVKGFFIGLADSIFKWLDLSPIWENFKKTAKDAIEYVARLVKGLGLDKLTNSVSKGGTDFLSGIKGFLGFKENGGFIPRNGLAFLHAGEQVLTRQEANNYNYNSSPTNIIYANIGNDYDVERLGERLSRTWGYDMGRRLMQ